MAYSVNWVTKVIFIPISDMTSLGGNDYELDADSFWREVRRLEWDFSEGLWADQILRHNNTRTLAGTTFVPDNEVINGYTFTFDPLAEKVFLVGDNNNLVDVFNFNGVVPVPSNTAGNTVTTINGDGPDINVSATATISEPILGQITGNNIFGQIESSELSGTVIRSDRYLKGTISTATAIHGIVSGDIRGEIRINE